MRQKGWIALDIDGTLTLDKYAIPAGVSEYLLTLHKDGWRIVLATGRACCFASIALKSLTFPFTLLAQNGSVALTMPKRELIFKKYLTYQAIAQVESACVGLAAHFVVYSGYDREDRCYWRPYGMSPEALCYVQELQTRERGTWEKIEEWDCLPVHAFPLIKCFGVSHEVKELSERLKRLGGFQAAQIRDPFSSPYSLLLVTDVAASKGASLEQLIHQFGRGERVIAAGDDENDLSLLAVADVKIAMPHAPLALQAMANVIAPPVEQQGIVIALKQVLASAGG